MRETSRVTGLVSGQAGVQTWAWLLTWPFPPWGPLQGLFLPSRVGLYSNHAELQGPLLSEIPRFYLFPELLKFSPFSTS